MRDTPAPLEYAPSRETQVRRRLRRSAIAVAVLVLIGWCAWKAPLAKDWLAQKRQLYAAKQRVQRCMTYQDPPDRVIWEERPPEVARLLASQGYVASQGYFSSTRFSPRQRAAAVAPPAPWVAYWGAMPKTFLNLSAVAFLHERTAKDGKSFLICVEFIPGHSLHRNLSATMIEQGTLSKWPRHNGPFVALELPPYLLDSPAPLRLFAGQADPADGSHFTIRYQLGEETGVFDGWLETTKTITAPAFDHWTVRLQPRPDPIARPGP